MKAYKQKNGRWKIYVFSHRDSEGKKHSKVFTCDTKKECERMASAFLLNKKEEQSRVSVLSAMNEYLESRSSVMSPATLKNYQSYISIYFESLRELDISELSDLIVQKEINRMCETLSPKTVRNAFGFLAVALRRYDVNIKVEIPRQYPSEIMIPSNEEVDAMLEASDPELRTAILLASRLGLRRGEIVALKWKNVDLDKRRLRIDSAVVKNSDNAIVTKKPKSVSGVREISIPASLAEYLKDLERSSEFVCNLNLNMITSRFKRMCRRIGLERFHFHCLRHFCASVLLELGCSDKFCMEYIGHSTLNMVKKYQHILDSKRSEYYDRVDRFFSEST